MLHALQTLPRFRLCALQVCLEDVLQPFQSSALSDAGVSEYLRACTVEEPLTGQVSLDLNGWVASALEAVLQPNPAVV